MEDLKDGMCRCCASEGTYKDFTASYQWMGAEEVYGDMLKDCFDITLSTSLVNNGGICEVCITQLRNAFNFKKQVQNTEEQFKRMQDKFLKGDIVKIELNNDPMENSDGGDNIDDDFSSPEYDVPIQSIKIEKMESKTKKRPARASTSKAKKPKVEVGEPSNKRKKTAGAIEKGTHEKCDILGKTKKNLKEILLCTNATPIRGKMGIGFACCFCSNQFLKPEELKKHTLEAHTDNIKTMKSLTNFSCRDRSKLCIKLDVTELACMLCEGTLHFDKVLEHLRTTHKKVVFTDIQNFIVPFVFQTDSSRCYYCNREYNSFKALLEHMNEHLNNYVCDICSAGFINITKLKMHTMSHLSEDFKCSYCTKSFRTQFRKRVHEKSVHMKDKRLLVCGYCKERFKSQCRKDDHLNVIHGVPLPKREPAKCVICEREYTNQNKLKCHMRRVHLQEKKNKCEHCDMEFFTTFELKKHLVKHTGAKNFRCTVCLKAFGVKETLRVHLMIHEGKKRFKCNHCGYNFTQKHSLQKHISSKHSGIVEK